MTKEQRSLIHSTIKEIYKKSIVGTTFNKAGKKYIKFGRHGHGGTCVCECDATLKNALIYKIADDNRTKWVWPHEYTYFVLHKENVDTMKAAADLARNLNANVSSMAYAGTKDKRGKTTQLFCMRKREPIKIIRAASRLNNVHVGNFHFKADTLKLGLLSGNR